MEKQNKNTPDPIKPNLKHDNMEYTASTDGDDLLDADQASGEETEAGEITAEELELLHNDNVDDLAAALNSAETDSMADEDNFIHEKEKKEKPEEKNIIDGEAWRR